MKRKCLILMLVIFVSMHSSLIFSQNTVVSPKLQTPNPTAAVNFIKSTQGGTPLILSHTSTGGNTLNGISIIRTEDLAGITNPIIIATSLWGKSSKTYYPKPILLRGFNNGEWGIDVSNPAVPSNVFNNVDFNILVSKPNENAFVHIAQPGNISGSKSRLNHPLLNGKPDAKFLITQVQADGVKNSNPCGILFENGGWHIVNLNNMPMPSGAKYNVIVSTQIVTITALKPIGHIYTIADKRIQNNNPNASVFTTTVINSNLSNPTETGVFYVKSAPASTTTVQPTTVQPVQNISQGNWAIFNQTKVAMPQNTQFNVLILEKGQKTSGSEWVKGTTPLKGIVDMHTHLMSHLGFGQKMMYGAPDVGSIIPAGTLFKGNDVLDAVNKDCILGPIRATTVNWALNNCNSGHGGWGLENDCGDHLRKILISFVDPDFKYKTIEPDHPHDGFPEFKYWPHSSSILHQQMWWEWLKRSWQGGIRVMVVLTVNNEALADLSYGNRPFDDKTVADLQIDETKAFVDRHKDFMEIAYTPEDMRRIVGSNRLAIVLGMEVDNIGNLGRPGVLTNETTVRQEIRRLYYDKGIRYIFPIHLTNNAFGGIALYKWLFQITTHYFTGKFIDVTTSGDPNINYNAVSGPGAYGAISTIGKPLFDVIGMAPAPCVPPVLNACPSYANFKNKFFFDPATMIGTADALTQNQRPSRHVNNLGLTQLGEVAINEMMKLGMIIDIDHMSEKAQNRTVEIATSISNGYPLNMGHNGLRSPGGNERNAPAPLITRISMLGGMFGIGTSGHNASSFASIFNGVWPWLGNKNIAIGTDVNGFEMLPHTGDGNRNNNNSDAFYQSFFAENPGISQKCGITGSNRKWDYIQEGGVSHYGLMPEFFHEVKSVPASSPTNLSGREIVNNLWNSAEKFVQMWEKCVVVKSSVP